MREVERTCDRVAIIKNGKLVATDNVNALKAAQEKKYIVTLESEEAAAAFAAEGLRVSDITGTQVTVIVQSNLGELVSVMNRYPVTDLTVPNQSLEEIFMQYFGGDRE